MKTIEKKIRLDKWLWYSRIYKSRSLASNEIKVGKFRLNGIKVKKASVLLTLGDIIIFSKGTELRAVKVLNLGSRRVSSGDEKKFYEELFVGC